MRTRAYRSHRNHPALPAQWFTTYTCPPRRPGFLATVAPEKLSPLKNLTPASGCQDHTTSSSASGALVRRTLRVHRSPPRERDDRDSPLWWDGMVRNMDLFWVFCKSEYFYKRGLTEVQVFCPSGKGQGCRPRASGDPYAAASRLGALSNGFGFNRRPGLWVPAFAGTTRASISHSRGRPPPHVTQRPGASRFAISVSTLTAGSQATAI